MKRRLLKVILLLIIFGVPVFWYLFLQLFGENQFELQSIRLLDETCWTEDYKVFYVSDQISIDEENQLSRLKALLNDREENMNVDKAPCIADTANYPLYLINQKNELIGMYDLTILEVDRLIVELDLINSLNK